MDFDDIVLQAIMSIGKQGFHVTYVSAVRAGDPVFAYTAGMTELGLPEFLLAMPLPSDVAFGILSSLAGRVLAGERFAPGQRLRKIIAGFEITLAGPVPAGVTEQGGRYPLAVARAVYGNEKVSGVQVVLPDADSLFPWEAGYAMPAQPLLAPVPPS